MRLPCYPFMFYLSFIYMIYNIALMESNYNIDNPLEFKKMLENMLEKSLPNLQTT